MLCRRKTQAVAERTSTRALLLPIGQRRSSGAYRKLQCETERLPACPGWLMMYKTVILNPIAQTPFHQEEALSPREIHNHNVIAGERVALRTSPRYCGAEHTAYIAFACDVMRGDCLPLFLLSVLDAGVCVWRCSDAPRRCRCRKNREATASAFS